MYQVIGCCGSVLHAHLCPYCNVLFIVVLQKLHCLPGIYHGYFMVVMDIQYWSKKRLKYLWYGSVAVHSWFAFSALLVSHMGFSHLLNPNYPEDIVTEWEYVDLADLLPASSSHDSVSTSSSLPSAQFPLFPGCELFCLKKCQIASIAEWVQAFTMYATALVSEHPVLF